MDIQPEMSTMYIAYNIVQQASKLLLFKSIKWVFNVNICKWQAKLVYLDNWKFKNYFENPEAVDTIYNVSA